MGTKTRSLRRVAVRGLVLAALAASAVGVDAACGFNGVGSGSAGGDRGDGGGDEANADSPTLDANLNGDATQAGCSADRTVCGTTCTDTKADPLNCGSCGKTCGAGETCTASTCGVLCIADTLACDNHCINPSTDPEHCGACNNACQLPTAVCVSAKCQMMCGAGQTLCTPDGDAGLGDAGKDGGTAYCASTDTDRDNCGACGKTCAQNQICKTGTCTDLCVAPATIGDTWGSPVAMVGCVRTKVTFTNRAALCPPGMKVCKATQWNALHGAKKPTFNYWTDDDLQWLGQDQACSAVPNGQGYTCYGDPMRVCAAHTDPLGNDCNYDNCGYGGSAANQYYGGCQGDPYAGVLCCAP